MRAWLLENQEGIDAVQLTEGIPDPHPAPGEVLLAMRYAALNPADRYLAEKQYPARPPMPHILGREGVGEVIVSSSPNFPVGTRVAILRGSIGVERWGTFAEKVTVPEELLIPINEGWTEQQAAGATLVYLTAWQAITQWGDAPVGSVLITGISGGVGIAALQLAKAMGLTVIGLSRGSQKHDALMKLGADLILDPADPDWKKNVKDFLRGGGVNIVIDNIAGEIFPHLIDTLAFDGKVSVVGRLAGPVPSFNTASLFFRRLRIRGVAVGTYTAREARAAWEAVLQHLRRSGQKPVVDTVFPFANLPDAFARLAKGPIGKVLLQVTGHHMELTGDAGWIRGN